MCSSARGPARAPSLVTWPTSTVATCRDLARPTSWSAHSRTWVMLPGTPLARRSPRVAGPMATAWIESITTRSGSASTTELITVPTSVAARISRPGGIGPRRSARSRTWWADSSADTSRTRCPEAARAASTWSSRVDLPIPGSPPRRVTEPGTRPPESTRSNSSTPVGTAVASDRSTEESGTGMAERSSASTARTNDPSCASSTRVFHSPQEGHRPVHLAEVEPQSMQRWRLAVFAIPRW